MRKFSTIVLLLLIGFPLLISAQGVGINNPTPDPSAILDLSFTSQGLLLPRMTTTQCNAIVQPEQGLWVCNTTSECLDIYFSSVGGGGYSGGGCGQNSANNAGGGGSYNTGTNQNNTPGFQTGNGQITISW